MMVLHGESKQLQILTIGHLMFCLKMRTWAIGKPTNDKRWLNFDFFGQISGLDGRTDDETHDNGSDDKLPFVSNRYLPVESHSVDSVRDERATKLLFQGLQLLTNEDTSIEDDEDRQPVEFDETDRPADYNVEDNQLGSGDTKTDDILRLTLSIEESGETDQGQDEDEEDDEQSTTQSKSVKILNEQSGYLNNTKVDHDDPSSSNRMHEKRSRLNARIYPRPNEIPRSKLQKDETLSGLDFALDVRFGEEEAAPSTQRQVINGHGDVQYSQSHGVHYATIENRPQINYELTHPPLQVEYPTAIQNNFIPKTRIAFQPTPQLNSVVPSLQAWSNAPIYRPQLPLSAPTFPPIPSGAQAQRVQYAASPIITSSYSNRGPAVPPGLSQSDKVVVKIVPATGWYLNNENERKSYYNAVSRGLLNQNGFVFVNNVQTPGPGALHRRSVKYEPLPLERRSDDDVDEIPFEGQSSYNVPLSSVGKLIGDSHTVDQPTVSTQ